MLRGMWGVFGPDLYGREEVDGTQRMASGSARGYGIGAGTRRVAMGSAHGYGLGAWLWARRVAMGSARGYGVVESGGR